MSLFARILRDSVTLEYLRITPDGALAEVNRAFATHVGLDPDALVGTPLREVLVANDARQVEEWLAARQAPEGPVLLNFVTASADPYTRRCIAEWSQDALHMVGEPDLAGDAHTSDQVLAMNNELATLSREHARRGKELEIAHQQLRKTMDELEQSYWHLRKIQEVIPSCMACGNIKTDEHTWQSVSDYLLANKIFVSHGYCPECYDRIVAEMGR